MTSSAASVSNLSISSAAFETEYKFPEWFTEKTLNFYKKKLVHLTKMRYIHAESASYYDRKHLQLYGPSIVITGLSGIVSFLSSSSMFNENTQSGLAIGVGVLASVSAMIQSAASAVDYNTKAKVHREAGEDYEKLITQLEFEMEMPNEEDFLDNFEAAILEIQNKCSYAPPKHIIEGYEAYLVKQSRKQAKLHKHNKHIKHNKYDTYSPLESVITEKTALLSNKQQLNTYVNKQSPSINVDNHVSPSESSIQNKVIDFTNDSVTNDSVTINDVTKKDTMV